MILRTLASLAIFASVIFSSVNAESFKIHRSACRRDALFKATEKGKKLVGDIVASVHATSLAFCARKCSTLTFPTCRTLNYKKKPSSSEDLNCQLLSVNKSNASVTLSAVAGWNHYESITQIGPRCRFTTCDPGYQCIESCDTPSGYKCIDINECLSNPCQNGGSCNNLVNKYTCTCVAGYEGTNCQTNINECASNPCQNSGVCNDGINQYTCSCAAGYVGTHCETNVNECASSPCLNGGACSDGVNQYTCSCTAGYTGTRCGTNVNECASSPCLNGGACSDGVNQYTCSCAAGYAGTRCETNVNECDSSPCLNGAGCSDGVNQYTCSCAAGYSGTRCGTNVNECASSPCLNGGACSDGVNQYTCSCAAGYAGTRCETNVNECASNPCQHGGTCSDHVNQYSCTCASGYSGTSCQTASTECTSYSTLTNADRHMSQKTGAYCDRGLSGWYRFMGAAGTMMPTSCVTANYCSTHAAGWLNGAHPSVSEGIVTRTVCFSLSGCCWQQTDISVRNCGSFFVYKLKAPPGCTYRYCGS